MQYPIIDLITDAYLNNGWTGLDISTGKNLADSNTILNDFLQNDGSFVTSAANFITKEFYVPQNGTYTFSFYAKIYNNTEAPVNVRSQYVEGDTIISGNVLTLTNDYQLTSVTINNAVEGAFFRISYGSGGGRTEQINNIMLERGSEVTPYEPYSEPKNDFPNRLKLPLPHYFPHPLIDALQRAAAGTQTADDTEILRHYLTPLGIGGI